jgi:hypothetical protein
MKKLNLKSIMFFIGMFFILSIIKTASSQEVVMGVITPQFKIVIGNVAYDQWGYDYNGYDRYGYDRDGYDREGYDRDGCNRDGYDREGYYSRRDRDDRSYYEREWKGNYDRDDNYKRDNEHKKYNREGKRHKDRTSTNER